MNREITQCSIQKYISIRPGDKGVYEQLAAFHYRNSSLGPCSHVFALFDEQSGRLLRTPVVGVIVYRPPAANLAARNRATGGFFSGLPRSAGLALLNQYVICISRLIIDPRYRGLGLAGWLVKETMPQTGAAVVEAASVRAHMQRVFERAAMTGYRRIPDAKTERMKAALEMVGIDEALWLDTETVHERLGLLEPPWRHFIERQIRAFLQKFTSRRDMPDSLERTGFILSKLGDPGRYYLWLNPNNQIPGLQMV